MGDLDSDAIYEILRKFQSELAGVRGDVNELRAELVALREQGRGVRVDVEDLNTTADALGRRVRRLERSLEAGVEPYSEPLGESLRAVAAGDHEPLARRASHVARRR